MDCLSEEIRRAIFFTPEMFLCFAEKTEINNQIFWLKPKNLEGATGRSVLKSSKQRFFERKQEEKRKKQ